MRHAVTLFVLRPLVGARFQVLFTLLFEVLFTFPHGNRVHYRSLGRFSLLDGPGRFTQNSSCSALLRIPLVLRLASNTGLPLSLVSLSRLFFYKICNAAKPQPHPCQHEWFGLFPAPPLLGNHCYFLFPGTKMFQFPALAPQLDEV